MPRKRTPQTRLVPHFRKARLRRPTSKELDLMLLAGCSCLLTVMYHPVADALQSIHSSSHSQGAIAAQASKVPQQSGSLYLSMPPSREEIREEEEEQT
ncbi:hypothetical protein [Leptothermofonsia sp. ETS-13]|uniref:hypothetical protein n=1 Tax=Leptothermofonsia sp. ETS-13 TaxID=3035696 RepID=UPI003BA054E8